MTDPSTTRAADPAERHPGVGAIVLYAGLCAVLIGGDLALKWWSFEHLAGRPIEVGQVVAGEQPLPDATRPLIPNVLALRLMVNRGAVFGLGQGQTWLLLTITFVAIGVIAWMFRRTTCGQWLMHAVLTLILAGAVGNLVDRIMFSAVRDMLWMLPGVRLPLGWHWPSWLGGSDEIYPWVFNLADVYLVVGIGTYLVRSVFTPERRPVEAPADAD